MSLKHLGPGSEFPPLKKGTLRLYSMVFCPYAQRARLVLAVKNIPFETVNIKLNKKPEWYLELNPMGQVPCLQHDDGRVLPESLIVSEYLDNLYSENKLIPADPYKNATQKLLIEQFSKVITGFYKIMRAQEEDDVKNLLSAFDHFENKLQEDFFGGDKPAFVDYMIWPWFERLMYLSFSKKFNFDSEKYPKLNAYIEKMKQQPAVKETIISNEIYDKFFEAYLSGQEPDYDVGNR